ncbi:MAG: exodeoxyribonuclease III [Gammaproteobacteria bacterium]
MRIIAFNANGLRSAGRKGFFSWFSRQKADILCVQELKAKADQIDDRLYRPGRFHRYLSCAERPGYSGVAIYSRTEPNEVVYGYGDPEFDAEGRYVEARFDDIAVASVYFPSGSSSEARQEAKFRFLAGFEQFLRERLAAGIPYIFCGDVNIAHRKIDLKNWRSNQKNSGFTPEERAWMDKLIDEIGFVDAFRAVNSDPDQYTWWSNRGQAWANNVGWRIDYHLISPDLAGAVERAAIYRRKKFSDHAPLTIDYDWGS